MAVVGHGVDLVEVSRITELVERHGDRLLDRCFTAGERDYSLNGRRSGEHLAVRFAAKEAVLKALGTGWTRGIAWTDVEVVRDASGRPAVALHGKAAEIAGQQGVTRWLLSLSHTGGLASASAIATDD